MKSRWVCLLPVLAILIAGSDSVISQEKDPDIGGTKLSKLVEAFKNAKSADDRANAAFTIAEGKAKAVSAVPLLASALKDKEVSVRKSIALALGTMGPDAKAAVPELIAALKDTDIQVRMQVMYALGSIGPDAKAAIPLLSEVLKNTAEKSGVRAAAAGALGQFKAEAKATVPLLTNSLSDKDAKVQMASAQALWLIDKANAKVVVATLREVLKSKDDNAKTGAVMTLKEIGPDAKDAVPELVAALTGGGMAGYYAREALGKIPAAEAALVAAYKSSDKNMQFAIGSVLLEYFPESAKKVGLERKKKEDKKD